MSSVRPAEEENDPSSNDEVDQGDNDYDEEDRLGLMEMRRMHWCQQQWCIKATNKEEDAPELETMSE